MTDRPNSAADCRLMVFAKAPLPGEVKSRLTPFLGTSRTLSLYEWMVLHCLSTAAHSKVAPVELWCAPSPAHPFFQRCAEEFNIRLKPQIRGDIGMRMADAFQKALQAVSFALLLGTDCPSVRKEDLREAAISLRHGTDAAFIPVEDGGYCLIGLRRYAPELFSGIAWGTDSVWEETRGRLRALHWTWRELPLRWDVDRVQDVDRLEREGYFFSHIKG